MVKPTPNGDAPGEAGAVAPAPRQAVVYRIYLQLQSIAARRFSGALAGHLVLCAGFDLRGAELAFATTIAGGVFLGIEPDPQRLKTAVRNGSCDFMVNTLDEALRVLKNELRKHTPLSAGLLGNPEEILPTIVERGVQPDLIADTVSLASHPPALDTLAGRGAQIISWAQVEAPENSASGEVVWTAANPKDLRRMDRIALESIPAEDRIRRRWMEQAPGNFYRQTPLERVVSLRPEELGHLLDALKNSSVSSAFQEPATVRWRDASGIKQAITL